MRSSELTSSCGRAILRASCLAIFCLGLPAARAQGAGMPDKHSRPVLLEPGFTADVFKDCHGQLEKPIPGTGGLRQNRFGISALECSPGGAWGDFIYMTGNRLRDFIPVTSLSRTDFQGNNELFAFGDEDTSMQELGFAPPGWRGGDSLFFGTIFANSSTSILTRIDPNGGSQGIFLELGAGSIISAAVDPTGSFDGDVFFWQNRDIKRYTSTGDVLLFASLPSTIPGRGEMRFGPGGVWGDDLYTAGLTLTPDGTATSFPGGFSEFDWAFGPRFDGDMFDLVRIEGEPSEIYRVKSDGSRTLFATAPEVSQVVFCNEALWMGGQQGCFAISEKTTGPK